MLYLAKAKIMHLFAMLLYGGFGATILILMSPERLSRLDFLNPA